MRCYLMIKGHIAAVEYLAAGSDRELIEEAHGHFARRNDESFDGFEVWDRARRVYGWPEEPASQTQPDGKGQSGPTSRERREA